MHWHNYGYAALCVVVPVAWGLIIYASTLLIERRLLNSSRKSNPVDQSEDAPSFPLEYHI